MTSPQIRERPINAVSAEAVAAELGVPVEQVVTAAFRLRLFGQRIAGDFYVSPAGLPRLKEYMRAGGAR